MSKNNSLFSDFDIELFKAGKHFKLYEKLGSHKVSFDGIDGIYFAVWAPNAKSVSVIGDFNNWNPHKNKLKIRKDESGIWEGFYPKLDLGIIYKYSIKTRRHNI